MKKYFCDLCNKESKELFQLKSSIQTSDIKETCRECYNWADDLWKRETQRCFERCRNQLTVRRIDEELSLSMFNNEQRSNDG